MPEDTPPFHNIAIAGFGLIGGSIALALRERWPSVRVTAVDRPNVLAHAAGGGAIDRAAHSVADLGEPDLLVLAAPVAHDVVLAMIDEGVLATEAGRDVVRLSPPLVVQPPDIEVAVGALGVALARVAAGAGVRT